MTKAMTIIGTRPEAIKMASVIKELYSRAGEYEDDVHIVYPAYFNLNAFHPVHEMLDEVPDISLIEPVDHESVVGLVSRAYLILTDSGGLQEEPPSLDKPVLVLRETTECPAVLPLGAAKRVGAGRETIVRETVRLLEDPSAHRKMTSVTNSYGDGHASQCIVQGIRAYSDGLSEEHQRGMI